MKKILVISDTHGYIGNDIIEHAKSVDEVWHAGDIGDYSVIIKLKKYVETVCVYGNIDSHDIRCEVSEIVSFNVEGARVLMTHIGGYPGKYESFFRQKIILHKPHIVVVGHSHILKVMFDSQLKHLHINPGAIGKKGFHKVRTMVKFEIDNGKPQNMQVIEYVRN